jgi:hypothetical protein
LQIDGNVRDQSRRNETQDKTGVIKKEKKKKKKLKRL